MTDGPAETCANEARSNLPTISVVIPVRPTESPSAAVESLRQVDYPPERFEVIVIPGHRPSRQRNLGVNAARGDIIFFLDNDSQARPDLFARAVACFDHDRVAGVGGPNIACGEPANLVEVVSECVLTIPLGTGRIKARYKAVGDRRVASERELILCNLAMRRSVLEEVGGIDERLYPNEENELISRIVSPPYAYHFVYAPDVVVYRRRPQRLSRYFRTIFGYGRGRVQQTFTRPKLRNLQHFLPLGFLLYLVAALFIRHPLVWAPAILYGLTVLAVGFGFAVSEKRIAAGALGVLMLAGTHLAYALGMLWGVLIVPFARRGASREQFEIRYVKTYDGWLDE